MDIGKILNPKKELPKKTITYDNPRENIDPHVKTRVLDTIEIIAQKIKSMGSLSFYTNALERMTINSSGNVGIGTTGPGAILSISKASAVLNSLESNRHLQLVTSDAQAIDLGPQIGFSGSTGGLPGTYSFGTIAGRKENGTAGNFAGYLQFATTQSDSTITERVRITSAGNVGIGTTTPSQKLEVVGTISGSTIYAGNGATGSFTTVDLKTVTVSGGIIITIV